MKEARDEKENFPMKLCWTALSKIPKIAILLCMLCLVMRPLVGEEMHTEITIHGVLYDYQWAHSSNEFAFLFTQDGNTFLYVFDAVTMTYRAEILLAESYQYSPNALGWLPDDTGFVLALNKHDMEDNDVFLDHYDEFYQYTFAERTLQKIYHRIDRLFHGIYGIVFDDQSSYWAVTYAGEGHPNVALYNNMEMIAQTEVYPSSIETLGWQHNTLYCMTDAFLEFGLTREQRALHPEFHEGLVNGRKDHDGYAVLAVYAIEPTTLQAQHVELSPGDIQNVSFNTQYHLTVNIAEDKDGWFFTFEVYKQ
jgi:hypothetical protein